MKYFKEYFKDQKILKDLQENLFREKDGQWSDNYFKANLLLKGICL